MLYSQLFNKTVFHFILVAKWPFCMKVYNSLINLLRNIFNEIQLLPNVDSAERWLQVEINDNAWLQIPHFLHCQNFLAKYFFLSMYYYVVWLRFGHVFSSHLVLMDTHGAHMNRLMGKLMWRHSNTNHIERVTNTEREAEREKRREEKRRERSRQSSATRANRRRRRCTAVQTQRFYVSAATRRSTRRTS